MGKFLIAIALIFVLIATGYLVLVNSNNKVESDPQPTPTPEVSLYSPARITKKPFGKYVQPGNSPVEPEKFTGFHTASDFETFDDEQTLEIAITAVCDGEIAQASIVSGYGGLIVQNCEFNNKKSKVLYGHVDLNFEGTKKAGDFVEEGEKITILAPAYTQMNGDERKHLHLGILKSNQLDYRGYVLNQNELDNWYNPIELLNF